MPTCALADWRSKVQPFIIHKSWYNKVYSCATTFLSTLISLVTLKSITCPVVIFLVLISLRTSKGIKVPAFKTTSLSARVKENCLIQSL